MSDSGNTGEQQLIDDVDMEENAAPPTPTTPNSESTVDNNAEDAHSNEDNEESDDDANADIDGDGEHDPVEAADGAGEAAQPPAGDDAFYGVEQQELTLTNVEKMAKILQIWENRHTQSGFDPVPLLKRLAEIVEKEKEIYMRKDPDPFDDRHPYRVDYTCHFGFLLKQLFRKDLFMNKLVNDYLRDNYFTRQGVSKSALEMNILSCRLILVIMPGLETSAVFQNEFDHLIKRIYSWAEDSIEPLQSYATGLLASAMEVTDIANSFREQNARLIPKMLKRLHMLQAICKSVRTNDSITDGMDLSIPAWLNQPVNGQKSKSILKQQQPQHNTSTPKSPSNESGNGTLNGSNAAETPEVSALESYVGTTNMNILLENSMDGLPNGNTSGSGGGGGSGGVGNTSNTAYKKNYIPIHPPTPESSQMLILRYLTSMGEYQEFLGLAIENYAIDLIFGYLDSVDRRDTCLVFEALKYLASMLCHKKFALDFLTRGGLEGLLKVPRPGIAATGVSIVLCYLAYQEDAMERICTFPRPLVAELVSYALWLVGHSYDSGRCHATMFFGLSFHFKVILEEFDSQDGLRKLYNVISVLSILNPTADDDSNLNEDAECANRQMVRHVCVALKRYMEAHLFYKHYALMSEHYPNSSEYSQSVTKSTKANLEQISEQIRTLQENSSLRAHWAPVDQLIKLGGITLLLKIIAFAYDWNNGGRAETLRSALDVLSICCVVPRVFNTYCEHLNLPDDMQTSGIYAILGAAAGDITTDAEVQKSALAALCNCVCAPIQKKESTSVISIINSSKRHKMNNRYMEEMVEKVWESVCSNNGIIVLLSLMQTKVPITDADCIRGMACRALAGLARSERVRQIVGKLPLYTSGQIQTLMRDPILQEKRAEHVVFQKYALELLERVSGKLKPFNSQLDPSLANIHKANVVAQTKIQYNEQQLYLLIHDHLESKGMTQTAHMLRQEAGIQIPVAATRNFHQSPFDYKVQASSTVVRQRMRNRMHEVSNAINNDLGLHNALPNGTDEPMPAPPTASITPIKLVKNKHLTGNNGNSAHNSITPLTHRSLQKQISTLGELCHHNGGAPISEEQKSPQPHASITLGTIVTEYLTNQHALCNNPMTTCPQFDLLAPHKCPDPKPSRVSGPNINITSRLFKAQAGYNTSRLDRRYVHSNFATWRTIRSNGYNNELQFTCCDIVPTATSNQMIVGTQQGEAKVFNMNDGNEEFSHTCHSDFIDCIKSNRTGTHVLTSCSWRSPLSVLWSISNNSFINKISFQDDFYCEFSNLTQDKIIGTQNDCAVIYDLNTGSSISTYTPQIANQYTKNRATFNPTDELILSDGVLWDVLSGKQIHKFDKLNQSLSGIFHPNGLEIISNTEVWDLRTFHLLQTVPVLNQCFLKFSPMRVVYGINLDFENRVIFDDTTNYETSFKVLDAYDYSSISTIDVRRNIYDLSVSSDGSLIALVENQPAYDSEQETFVKIYAVGVKKSEQQDEVRCVSNHDADDDDSRDQSNAMSAVSPGRRNGRHTTNIMLGGSHARQRRRQSRRFDNIGHVVYDNDVVVVNRAQQDDRRHDPAIVANWGPGGGGGDGGVAAGDADDNNVNNNNFNFNNNNDVVAQRMRDFEVLRGGDNALLRQAHIQVRQQQQHERRRHRNRNRRNSRGEREQGHSNLMWLDGGGIGPSASAAAAVGGGARNANASAGVGGAGIFRARQRARNGMNAPIAAVVDPAVAAAALAAAALQRNPRGPVGHHVLTAARSAYQRLAQRHNNNMNRANPPALLRRGTLTRRRRNNRAFVVRRPAAAAAPLARLYRPPAATPLSPADEAAATLARLRRNDLDFEIFDELDQLANNIISLLAGR